MSRFLKSLVAAFLIALGVTAVVSQADINTFIISQLQPLVKFLGVTGTNNVIVTNSADGADSNSVCFSGGGACDNSGRGAWCIAYGNEAGGGNAGFMNCSAGNVANSEYYLTAPGSGGRIVFRPQGAEAARVDSTGLAMQVTGKTISIDSGTAASACKGTGTHNGTTAVTITTTCAATGSIPVIQDTSDPTGSTAAYCWVTNIVNGTSFDVDCDQANDGTFSWFIIKEG